MFGNLDAASVCGRSVAILTPQTVMTPKGPREVAAGYTCFCLALPSHGGWESSKHNPNIVDFYMEMRS